MLDVNISLPFLSKEDPEFDREGSIDPLGLYAVADSLGTRLVPGVRERQKNPRYLTAIVAGQSLLRDYDDEVCANDKVGSEPWQVYEWMIVDALASKREELGKFVLPGVDKVLTASKNKTPLCAANYLKTPNVFGIHGVYRLLMKKLRLANNDGEMSQNSVELVNVWENERNLKGFFGGHGIGRKYADRLRRKIDASLSAGYLVDKHKTRRIREFFAEHLGPLDTGTNERRHLIKYLKQDLNRKILIEQLCRKDIWELWQSSCGSERELHQKIIRSVDDEFSRLLIAIDEYEYFARMLHDVFYDSLYKMKKRIGRYVDLNELADNVSLNDICDKIPEQYSKVCETVEEFGEQTRFYQNFECFSEKMKSKDFLKTVFAHHMKVQQNKPPNGRNAWIFNSNDRYIIRTPYISRACEGIHQRQYVHAYRTNSLLSFLIDLKEISWG